MKAFTDTKITKARLIASLEAHAAADRFRGGAYWKDQKGCAVGCTLHDFAPDREGWHALYEPLFGIPEALARLEDVIFEWLDGQAQKDWPLRFARALPEGADLSQVATRFLLRILTDPERGTRRLCDEAGQRATDGVVLLLERRLAGDEPSYDEWEAAAQAARTADAAWVADGADRADEVAALAAAAQAAAARAGDAALAAAWAAWAGGAGARAAHFTWMADVLIEEIERSDAS